VLWLFCALCERHPLFCALCLCQWRVSRTRAHTTTKLLPSSAHTFRRVSSIVGDEVLQATPGPLFLERYLSTLSFTRRLHRYIDGMKREGLSLSSQVVSVFPSGNATASIASCRGERSAPTYRWNPGDFHTLCHICPQMGRLCIPAARA